MDSNTSSLVDVSWNIGVTTAVSCEAGLGKAYVHFKLTTEPKNAAVREVNARENVHLNFTPAEFYKLLHEMERAMKSLEEVTRTEKP